MKERSQSPRRNGDTEKPDQKASSPRSEEPDVAKDDAKASKPTTDEKVDKKPVCSWPTLICS